MILQILLYSFVAFAGFAVGRIFHLYLGHTRGLHHWVHGLIITVAGGIFRQHIWGYFVMLFGIGLFISDAEDFLKLKFYGRDEPGEKRFWGID
jgi:hypothetical protein